MDIGAGRKTMREKRVEELRQQRYEKAVGSLKRWQFRLKRAERQVRKLKLRVKYYEGLGVGK
jgi:hypothetical protein